jgi:hypothetical protein
MANHNGALPTISRAKQRAKKLKKELNMTHAEALQYIAIENGFSDWESFHGKLRQNEIANIPTPQLSMTPQKDTGAEVSRSDYEMLEFESKEELSGHVKNLVSDNKRQLTKLGIEFSVFEPTRTGLEKSILDATQHLRVHFELEGFHCYQKQQQGPDYKVIKDAFFLNEQKTITSKASLYRPKTKKGDPRIWFRKLPSFCHPDDQLAIIIRDGAAFLINLNISKISDLLEDDSSDIGSFLHSFAAQRNSVAEELLEKLRELARFPFSALRTGDTAIGYTLESKLGIAANSSPLPDYKGIELKAGRGSKSRTTLFAQVADWGISPCKKSSEILDKYGYQRGKDFKLYCSISALRENTQGLSFIYNEAKDQLEEWHSKKELVAVWPGKRLREKLQEKHKETFWIEAESNTIEGIEQFQLIKVIHTRSPMIGQLMPLIGAGVVTMDHLIKRKHENNQVLEKGPLFKINKRDLEHLFPQPVTYFLKK